MNTKSVTTNFWTTRQAAEYLQVTEKSVLNYANKGLIFGKPPKKGKNRQWLFDINDIMQFRIERENFTDCSKYLSAKQVATLCGVHVRTITNHAKIGLLQGEQAFLGNKPEWRFSHAEVTRYRDEYCW